MASKIRHFQSSLICWCLLPIPMRKVLGTSATGTFSKRILLLMKTFSWRNRRITTHSDRRRCGAYCSHSGTHMCNNFRRSRFNTAKPQTSGSTPTTVSAATTYLRNHNRSLEFRFPSFLISSDPKNRNKLRYFHGEMGGAASRRTSPVHFFYILRAESLGAVQIEVT